MKEAFGSLFDKQELVRAAIMFAGALATGASPGRALAFAGQNYLSRIDNKASMHAKQVHEFAKGGKFIPSSVAAYSKSKDLRDLRPLTGGGSATGTYETFHSPHGSVKGEKFKIADGVYEWRDSKGNRIDGRLFDTDKSKVPKSKEWNARIEKAQGNIKSTIEAIGKRKDEFKLDDGTTGYKTDIVADVNAGKIATWAIENDIDPNELPGLVASAYDVALTQKRQDGAKPNDLTPYLQQLIIRNRVRQNADAFKIPGKAGDPSPVSRHREVGGS